MYTRTLKKPLSTESGGAITHIDIAGILCWDPKNKKLKISVSYGVRNGGSFSPSQRHQDNFVHQFSTTGYNAIVASQKDEAQLWTAMYDRLGEEKVEAKSF